jgi:hypothetical protein
MADTHSTPHKAGVSERRRVGSSPRSRSSDQPRSHTPRRANRSRRQDKSGPPRWTKIVGELEDMTRRLRIAYSTCVAAQLALKGQGADQDLDVLATLQQHVSDPISRQCDRLSVLVLGLRGYTMRTVV